MLDDAEADVFSRTRPVEKLLRKYLNAFYNTILRLYDFNNV